jgi:hypothetical protein
MAGDEDTQASSGSFVWVPLDTSGRADNHPMRRSHVMHHNHKTRPKDSSASNLRAAQVATLSAGQKAFRLTSHGLEAKSIGRAKRRHAGKAAAHEGTFPKDFNTNQSEKTIDTVSNTRRQLILSNEERHALSRLSTSPLLAFGASRIDAFGVLAVELTHLDEDLIARFCNYEKWPWCPISAQSLWGSFALSDQLAFSSTMYTWSMGVQSRLAGTYASNWLQTNQNALRHRLNTISAVNVRLSDHILATADETIAAVAMLAQLELLFGEPETARSHVRGLQALVAQRGGIGTFVTPLQLLFRRLISWTDLIHSEMFTVPLSYAPQELWDHAWHDRDALSLPGSPLGMLPTRLKITEMDNHELLAVLHDVRQLSLLETAQSLHTLPERQRMERCDTILALEKRLEVIVRATDTDASGNTDVIWKCASRALLIYVHHFLRHVPCALRYVKALIAELLQTLAAMSNVIEQLAFSRPFLFWTLLLATSTSKTIMSRPNWLMQTLVSACIQYSMTADDIPGLLKEFLWTGEASQERFAGVLQELSKVLGAICAHNDS